MEDSSAGCGLERVAMGIARSNGGMEMRSGVGRTRRERVTCLAGSGEGVCTCLLAVGAGDMCCFDWPRSASIAGRAVFLGVLLASHLCIRGWVMLAHGHMRVSRRVS